MSKSRARLVEIFRLSQDTTNSHERLVKLVEKIYNEAPFDEFAKEFIRCLLLTFCSEVPNPFAVRIIEFAVKFCITTALKSLENENDSASNDSSYDISTHPLLSKVLEETLKCHTKEKPNVRFYCCKFITILLPFVGEEIHLNNEVYDTIQDAMLQHLTDDKPNIRLEAARALIRLQDPGNTECPVVKGFIDALTDSNADIRREITHRIAFSNTTLNKIKLRLTDVSPIVREAAFGRYADINPTRHLPIADRHLILTCGFMDESPLVKKIFFGKLLPKWLTCYDGSILKFFFGLKLDSNEQDIENTEFLYQRVMNVFLKNHVVEDILKVLPINEEKLINIKDVSSEVATYWSLLATFLRKNEEYEEHLEKIIPEMTAFSKYIEKFIEEKSSKQMDNWDYMEYEFVLRKLFDMVSGYDFSDEVGRKTLYSLILNILLKFKFQQKLILQIVAVGVNLQPDINIFTNDVIQIISEIREPLVEEQVPVERSKENNIKIKEITTQINMLEMDKEDALAEQNYALVQSIHDQIVEKKRLFENINLEEPAAPERVRMCRDDPITLCRCLDILIALLKLPKMKKIGETLRFCLDDFVIPLLENDVAAVHWKTVESLVLFSIIDRPTAMQHAKLFCIPILSYRAKPNFDRDTLKIAVRGITDLLRIYGTEILGVDDDNSSTVSQAQPNTRKLYSQEDLENIDVITNDKINVEYIIDVMLDMLDDEHDELRDTALHALAGFVLNNFLVNHQLISRLILKWYNPLLGTNINISGYSSMSSRITEKQDNRLQQKLGLVIKLFSDAVKQGKEVLEKAAIPVVLSLANAPRSSPLADVDIDNVLKLLSALTNTNGIAGIVNVHRNLATSILHTVVNNNTSAKAIVYLIKFLKYLDVAPDTSASIRELSIQAENILESVHLETSSKKALTKFKGTLCENLTTVLEETEVTENNSNQNHTDAAANQTNRQSNNQIHEEADANQTDRQSKNQNHKEAAANQTNRQSKGEVSNLPSIPEANETASGGRTPGAKKRRRRRKSSNSSSSSPDSDSPKRKGKKLLFSDHSSDYIVETPSSNTPVSSRSMVIGNVSSSNGSQISRRSISTSQKTDSPKRITRSQILGRSRIKKK